MTTLTNPISIFDNLRVPEPIRDLPLYDGNPNTLNSFITLVDQILSVIPGSQNSAYVKILNGTIWSKMTGAAAETLVNQGTPIVWEDIKTCLINKFGERRNKALLLRDLHEIKQNNDSIEVFYNKIINMQSKLINHANFNENNVTIRNKEI